MQASKQMLLNFGVRESEIPKNRWRRIEMVRKFSSAAALEGRAGAAANKFARGSRLTLMQQQEIFMKKAQEIWDAQLKVGVWGFWRACCFFLFVRVEGVSVWSGCNRSRPPLCQ